MYSVDEISGNLVTLIANDHSIKIESIDLFNFNVKEGDIVDYNNGKYFFNKEQSVSRKENIMNLLNNMGMFKSEK